MVGGDARRSGRNGDFGSVVRVKLLSLVAGLCAACTSSASQAVGVANCEPADGSVLTGSLDGEEWEFKVEEFGDFSMLTVEINGLDQGAVELGPSTWYHAEAGSIVILAGGLPSRTTQAVAATAHGASLAFCPFGDGDLLVAAGAVGAGQVVDLEFHRGGAVGR